MATLYPSQIDNLITLPSVVDGVTPFNADVINRLRDTLLTIEATLGINPASVYVTVRHRLDVLEQTINGGGGGGGNFIASGDLAGTLTSQVVVGLRTAPILNILPLSNQVLTFNGSAWYPGNLPATLPPTGPASGDLSGVYPNPIVTALQGNVIASTSPTSGQVLEWNASTNKWTPTTLASSFTAGGDLSGNSVSQNVIAIHGATVPVSGSLTTGNILQVNGSNSLTYASVNLAGGSNYVVGTLPVGNLPSLSGDVTGNINSNTVAKINGVSVPANPVDGYILAATSGTSAIWSPLSSFEIISSIDIIFAPGGTIGQNVYTNENALIAALANTLSLRSLGYQVRVIFNFTNVGGSYTFSNQYNFLGDIWYGAGGGSSGGQANLVFANNGSFGSTISIFPTIFDSVHVSIGGVLTGPLYIASSLTNVTLQNGTVISAGALVSGGRSGNAQFIKTAAGASINLTIRDDSSIQGYALFPLTWAIDITHADNNLFSAYTQAFIESGTIGTEAFGWSNSPTAAFNITTLSSASVVDPSFYSHLTIQGLYIDSGITGFTAIPAALSIGQAIFSNSTAYVSNGTSWIAISSGPAGGDLSGTYPNPTVSKIQGNAIQSGVLTSVDDGYFLSWVNAANQWEPVPGPSGSFSAGHDLSGSSSAQTVVGIQGNQVSSSSPLTGNSLKWSGTLWTPSALSLAGGVNSVTGILPTGNQAAQSLTLIGDVTSSGGTTASATTVAVKINGTSVPSGPSANQVLVATSGTTAIWQQIVNAQIGASAAIAYSKLNLSGSIINADVATGAAITYSKLNLTGNIVNADIATAAAITVNKLASGTSAQILLNNNSPTPTWTTISGDATISSSGVVTNTGLRSISVPSPTGTNTVLTYNAGVYLWSTSSAGITQLTGDVLAGPGSGSQAATVVALQNNPLQSGILGSIDDGYVLTWVNGSTQWQAKPIPTSFVPSGTGVVHIVSGVEQPAATLIVNADVDPTAAIAYSKLNLTGDIVNSDISPTAAISGTKINPNFGNQVVQTTGDGYFDDGYFSGIVTVGGALSAGATTASSIKDSELSTGVVHADASGNFTSSPIVNADVSASAAIAYSKLNLAGDIVNSDISSSAAIDGTKINPNFGNQVVQTTGDGYFDDGYFSGILDATALTVSSIKDTGLSTGIVHSDASGNFTSSAVNLASGDVTGVLSTAHQASQNMAGDVTGTTAAATVIALQNHPVTAEILGPLQDGYVLTWDQLDGYWVAKPTQGGAPSGPASGDLGGNYPGPLVIAIQGNSIEAGILSALEDGYVLTWNNSLSRWEPQAITSGSVTLNGDVSGPATANNVVNIHGASVPLAGALIPGNVLQVNGSASLTYAPINLAGGSNYVSGVLPTANQAAQTLTGDVTGTTASNIISEIQSNPVALGTLGTSDDGYVMTWNGTDLVMEPPGEASFVNLIGDVDGLSNANTVTAIQNIPVSATAPTTNQVLEYTGSEWSPTTLASSYPPSGPAGGDLSGTYPNPDVNKLQGNTLNLGTLSAAQDGYIITWLNSDSALEMKPAPTGSFSPGGDLTGSSTIQTVAEIQGNLVNLGTLGSSQDGYVMTWNNGAGKLEMEPIITPVETLNGDVIGLATSNVITEIQGNVIDLDGLLGALQDGYVLAWNNTDGKLEMAPPTAVPVILSGDVTGISDNNTVGFRKTFLLMGV